jgi:DNA-binding transcriptional LysR family regulator
MESELKDFTSGMKGQVRVFSNSWGITEYLPADLASFLSAHPKIHVDLREGVSAEIIRAVEENAADVGIIVNEVPAPGLKTLPYRTDNLVAVITPDHPLVQHDRLKLSDLLAHEVIGHRQYSAINRLLAREAEACGQMLRPRIAVTGFEAVCRMAEADLGVGLVPSACADRYLTTMRLVARPLDEAWATRTLSICHTPSPDLPATARLLAEHLSDAGSRSAKAPR